MDLVILIVLIAIVVFVFKSFDSFVYFIAIADIFLRIITFICDQFGQLIPELTTFLKTYIPANIPTILDAYSYGVFNQVLKVGYIVIFIMFEFYIIKAFFKKR